MIHPDEPETLDPPANDRSPRRSARRFGWWLVRVLPVLVAVWVVGDFVYSRVVERRIAAWEATIERSPEGVQRGHEAYSVGEGSTALLMVHGINFSPYVYRNLAPSLAERGFHCQVMRLPGFATPIHRYAESQSADWVAAVLAELEILRAKYDRVVVVGHSLGGAVTLNTLLQHHPAIDGVVLIAPAVEVSAARSPLGVPTRFWHEFANWTLWFTQIAWSPFEYDLNDPQARAEAPQQPFTPRTIVDGTFQLIDANRGRAGELNYPLLMAVSPTDKIVDTDAATAYFEAWGSPHKSLLRVERAAHMIPLDYDWESVVEAIAKFAQELPDPPTASSPRDSD